MSGQDAWRNADELFEAMNFTDSSWVADIGSREGYYTIRMAPKITSGWVFAVDINADALEDLHENLKSKNIKNVTPVFSVQENPMLPEGVLDAVLIRNTYHEFTEPLSMLGYIRKSLKPSGRLVIAEAIADELKDASRTRQARSHDIALHFVRDDLEQTGFRILKEDEPFTETRRGQHYWILIAVPDQQASN